MHPARETHLATEPASLDLGHAVALLAAGLAVSLASDDPPMFATSLVEEYRRCAAAYGWDADQVRALAAAAVRHSCLPEPRKAELLAEQARVAAELAAGVGSDRDRSAPARPR